jgi:hypothetical protein
MAWLRGTVAIVLLATWPVVTRAQGADAAGSAPGGKPCAILVTALPDCAVMSAAAAAPDEPPASPKRILGIIPNFTTTDDTFQDSGPLAAHHKFVLAFDQMFDVSAHLGNLFQASIQQATGGQPHYAADAFGKRLAAAEADQISSCLFIYGALPSVLHTDPRYFRREAGPATSRAWYAVTRTFVTRRDDGARVMNVPQLAGQLAQAGLSNVYYPEQDRTVSGTMTNWAIQLAYNSAFNVLKEFYPDVVARFHRHAMRP